MKKLLFIALMIFIISPVYALKVENLPINADFYLGMVNGPGTGLDFGVKVWFPFEKLKLGGEIEQLITDVNYSASINGLRYGLVASYAILPDLKINGHVGSLGFKTNKDLFYKDMDNKTQNLNENINYKGSYWGVSLDYSIWELVFEAKYVVNSISDKGSIAELDLNIEKSF